MAKKSIEPSPGKPGVFKRIGNFLRSEQTSFMVGLTLLMIAVYFLIAYISYFFTGDYDQSKVDNLGVTELSRIGNGVRNWTGSIGAYLAHVTINGWMGVSTVVIWLFLAKLGLKLMQAAKLRVMRAFIYTCVTVIWGSIFFGFFFVSQSESTYLFLGGQHGYYIGRLLEANLGFTGTLILVLGTFLLFMLFISNRTMPLLRSLFGFGWLRKKKKEEETMPLSAKESAEELLIEEKPSPVIEEVIRTATTTDDDYAAKKERLINEDNIALPEVPEILVATPAPTPVVEEEGGPVFTIEDVIVEEEYNAENLGEYDPTLDLSSYRYPTFDLLSQHGSNDHQINMEEQTANKKRIIETLENYGIRIESIKATVGPTITLYEIVPEAGVRIAKIRNLEDDIALSLSALGIRIIAPIPGKGTIGIEVPNKDAQIVSMHSILASKKFQEGTFDLPVALGKTITNEIFMVDLSKMPHILVAGATGQGKSVGLNAIIASLLYKKHPSQLKFVLVDPKKVEFNIYAAIEKHFLAMLPDAEEPIITDVHKVVQTLNSITREMDNRYDLLKKAHTRNVKEYNAKFVARKLNPNNGHYYMPYIVVIIDEFGDLIMTAGKEIELPIARIAQLARAVGIHMIIATQRPTTNIITGTIKANFPARVAFKVSSMIDSRTILDCPGANQLIGRGDLLFSQGSDLVRVQCAFIDTPEVEAISAFIGDQRGYTTAYQLPEYETEGDGVPDVDLRDRDSMFDEAARLIVANQQGSTSLIQRKFAIGYNRAGRLMDQLEAAGIVGPFEGSKARQVLVMDEMHLDQLLNSLKDR